jgi:hypothetical protein
MRVLLVIALAISLTLTPFAALAEMAAGGDSAGPQAAATAQQPAAMEKPPVSPPLVAEGSLALKLTPALKLGSPATEAEAEDLLAAAGITPGDGWIADYPVTPVVVGDLQQRVATAADAKKIPLGREAAAQALQGVLVSFDLAVLPGVAQSGQTQAAAPGNIDEYYGAEGPPVVTYYAPPPDYAYLYDWVPYPFYSFDYYFAGFYILNDFDLGHFRHDHHRFSNHFRAPGSHHVYKVEPRLHSFGSTTFHRGPFVGTQRRDAESIFNESARRNAAPRTGFMGPSERQFGRNGFASPSFRSGNEFRGGMAGGEHGPAGGFGRGFGRGGFGGGHGQRRG